MQSLNFEEAIRKIVAADDRYQYEAYLFVQEAIHYTQKSLGRHKQEEKHVAARNCSMASAIMPWLLSVP